jgi:hypothetical protein
MEKYLLTIISSKDDKINEVDFECDNMVSVVRIMMTYKGKKGYQTVQYMVDRVETLV